LFSKYFDQQYELIDRLRPEVIGHFDLCRLYYPEKDFRDYPEVWEKVKRNIGLGVEYGALFELNASAFRKGWKTGYPGVEVFDVSFQLSLSLCLAHAQLMTDFPPLFSKTGNPRSRRKIHTIR